MTLSARYQLNGDDGLECFKVHHPNYNFTFFLGVVSSALLILIGLLWLALPGSTALAWVSIGFGAAGVGLVLQRVYLVRLVRRTWSQIGPIELEVRESGFTVTERGIRSEVNWTRYIRLRESPRHFLLYQSADIYAIVPKRGFANEEDVLEYRQIATRGIGNG